MKYKITIEQTREGTEKENYPKTDLIYLQETNDDIVRAVILVVNSTD